MKPEITPTNIRDARFAMSRRLLVTLSTFYGIAALLLFAVAVHLGEGKSMILAGINTLLALLAFLLQKKDHLQIAGTCVTFGLLLTGLYAAWTSPYGLQDDTVIILPVACVMAAMLLRTRVFLVLVVVSVAGTLMLGFREKFGYQGGPDAVEAPFMDLMLVIAVVLVVTLGLRRLNTGLWATLNLAVDNEHKLLENQQALLQQTQLARQSEQRWRSLVDSAPDHILQLDAEGRIIFCNHLEGGCAQALGELLVSVVVPEDRPALEAAVRTTLEKENTARVECVTQMDEKPRTFIFNFGPLRDENGRVGAIVLVSDVTERNRLREQLLRSQKLDSLGRLAGGIAHDFNNLLTVICGHAELAEMQVAEDSELAENLRVIRRTGDRAADLTQQILAFGRRQSLRLSPLRLEELLAAMENLLGPLIGEDIKLEVTPDPDLPPILADRSQLEQVVTNLVINARDAIKAHASPSARKIRLSTRLVTVDERMLDELLGLEPGDHVELMVSDTGTGMTREVQQRLFEPFFTTKKPGEGTGLGLATVYGIVHQSKGAIRVYSEPGLGTSFKVYWPVAGKEAAGDATQPGGAPSADLRGKEHVLLVEDDPAVLKLACSALEDLGYRVSTAEDGEKALEIIAAAGDVDIVVSDVVMPGIGGFELAEMIPHGMPILLTSGYAEDAWTSNNRPLGRDQFLQKPYGPADLAEMIRQRLDSRKTMSGDPGREANPG